MPDTFRRAHRVMTQAEAAHLDRIKERAQDLLDEVRAIPECRETEYAKARLEESVMWATKGLTA